MGAPQRVTAWHGIRMTRELNNDYLTPLTANFPKARLGPTGDVAKVNCATCHQGAFKPLYGAPLVKDHPELVAAAAAVAPAPAPEPAAPAAPAKKK
jgi:photosynthetic reaction center cytochrome c subunit